MPQSIEDEISFRPTITAIVPVQIIQNTKFQSLPHLRNGSTITVSQFKYTCAFDSYMQSLIGLKEHPPIIEFMSAIVSEDIDFILTFNNSDVCYERRNRLLDKIYPTVFQKKSEKKSCYGTIQLVSDYITKNYFHSVTNKYKCSKCSYTLIQRDKYVGIDYLALKEEGLENLNNFIID